MISYFKALPITPIITALSVLFFLLGTYSLFGFHNMSLYPAYKGYLSEVSKEIIDQYIFEADCQKQVVAITFDDGPIENTKEIVNLLRKREIPATFFVISQNITSTYAQLYDDPLFELGMHSYVHKDYRNMSDEEISDDFRKCKKILEGFSISASYFRPPYGILSPKATELMKENDLAGILWSLDSLDWAGKDGENLVSHITENLKKGSIILFHDRIDIQDLTLVLDSISKAGYDIIPLGELLRCE